MSTYTISPPCFRAVVTVSGVYLNGSGQWVSGSETRTVEGRTSEYTLALQYWGRYQNRTYNRAFVNGVSFSAPGWESASITSVVCEAENDPCALSVQVPVDRCNGVHTVTVSGIHLNARGQFIQHTESYTVTGQWESILVQSRRHPFGTYQGFQLYQFYVNDAVASPTGWQCGASVTGSSTVCEESCTDCCAQYLDQMRALRIAR